VNKKKIISFILLSLLTLFVAGCGGSQFAGSWVNTENPQEWAKITESGSSFVWEDDEGKYPAKYKDDILAIDTGFGTAFASINKDGNMETTFMGSKDTYKKK